MNIQESAKVLRLHPTSLLKMVKEGRIAGEKIKGAWDIPQAEIDRLLARRYEINRDFVSLAQAAKSLGLHYQTVWE
jgi:hypothetical protein